MLLRWRVRPLRVWRAGDMLKERREEGEICACGMMCFAVPAGRGMMARQTDGLCMLCC